jgi:hypothetical protein
MLIDYTNGSLHAVVVQARLTVRRGRFAIMTGLINSNRIRVGNLLRIDWGDVLVWSR